MTETLISINDACISPLCCVPSISVLLFSTRKIFGDVKRKKEKKNWRKKIEIKRNIRPSWKGAGFRRELLRDPVKSFANPCKFRFFHRIFFISPQSYWCFLAFFFFFSFSSRISSLEKPTISPTQLFYISIKYQPWITNISRFELTSTTILNSSLPPLSLPLSPRFDWRALTIGDRTKHNERTISKIGYRFIYIENSFPILILSFVHYFNRKKKKKGKKRNRSTFWWNHERGKNIGKWICYTLTNCESGEQSAIVRPGRRGEVVPRLENQILSPSGSEAGGHQGIQDGGLTSELDPSGHHLQGADSLLKGEEMTVRK